MEAGVKSTQEEEATTSVHDLHDAGKVVVEAAGTVAVDRLRTEVDARSSRAAVEIKTIAVAMRASSASLREQGNENQAAFIDEIAGRADRLASRLASADSDDLVEDAKRLAAEAAAFARKEPVLVIAGAFTLGLLVPKVLDAIGDRTIQGGGMMDENEQSTVETVTEKAGEAASAVGTGAKKVVSAVAENPVLAAAGAAAVGAAVGGTALAREKKKKKASASSKKRQPAKKSSAKTATRRSPAKKSTAKKSTAKKSTAKKSPRRKKSTTRAGASKSKTRKPTAKSTAKKSTAAKRTSSSK